MESGGSNEVFSQPQHPLLRALLSVIPRLTRTATSGSMRFQAMSRSMKGYQPLPVPAPLQCMPGVRRLG